VIACRVDRNISDFKLLCWMGAFHIDVIDVDSNDTRRNATKKIKPNINKIIPLVSYRRLRCADAINERPMSGPSAEPKSWNVA